MNYIFALDLVNLGILVFLLVIFLIRGLVRFNITSFYLLDLILVFLAVLSSLLISRFDDNYIRFHPDVIYFLYSFYYLCMGSVLTVFLYLFLSILGKGKSSKVLIVPLVIYTIFAVTFLSIYIFIDSSIIMREIIRNYLLMLLYFEIFFINIVIIVYYLIQKMRYLNKSIIYFSLLIFGVYFLLGIVWVTTHNYSAINLVSTIQLLLVYVYLILNKNTRIYLSFLFTERKAGKTIMNAIRDNSFNTEFLPIYNLKREKYTIGKCRISLQNSERKPISNKEILQVAKREGYSFSLEKKLVYRVCKFYKDNEGVIPDLERIDVELSVDTLCSLNKTSEIIDLVFNQNIAPGKVGFELFVYKKGIDCENILHQVSRLNDLGFHVGVFFKKEAVKHSNLILSYLVQNKNSYMVFNKADLDFFLYDKRKDIASNMSYFLCKKMNFSLIASDIKTKDELSAISDTVVNYACGPYFSDYLNLEDFLMSVNFHGKMIS